MDLRDKLKHFERDFSRPKTVSVADEKDIDHFIEGEEKSNESGNYFLSSTIYPADTKHGNISLNLIQKTDPNIFRSVARDEIFPSVDFSRILFIDTETTGLAGGTGTVPFLIGIGYYTDDGFQVDQYFMRDYHEETAILNAVKDQFDGKGNKVTYDGSFRAAISTIIEMIEQLPSNLITITGEDYILLVEALNELKGAIISWNSDSIFLL